MWGRCTSTASPSPQSNPPLNDPTPQQSLSNLEQPTPIIEPPFTPSVNVKTRRVRKFPAGVYTPELHEKNTRLKIKIVEERKEDEEGKQDIAMVHKHGMSNLFLEIEDIKKKFVYLFFFFLLFFLIFFFQKKFGAASI